MTGRNQTLDKLQSDIYAVPSTSIEAHGYTNTVGDTDWHLAAIIDDETHEIAHVRNAPYATYLATAAWYLPELVAVLAAILRYCNQYPTHPDDKKTREALAGVRHLIDRGLPNE